MNAPWKIGRTFTLRHAGMPFDWLEELGASSALLGAAEDVLRTEQALIAAAEGQRAEQVRIAVGRGDPAQLSVKGSSVWRAARAAWVTALDDYRRAYDDEERVADGALRRRLAEESVQHAVWLSNPEAYHNMLRPYLEHEGPLNARWRRVRRQMYTYLQRFCAKNETVSFFGPLAYGTVVDGPTRLETAIPRRRKVFFAHWALRALVRVITKDRQLLPDLPIMPTGKPADRAASDVATLVGRLGDGCSIRDAQRRSELTGKAFSGALAAALRDGCADFVLGGGPYDEGGLPGVAAQLAALPPSPARDRWRAHVDHLEDLRRRFESTNDLDTRIPLLAKIEALFTEVTGAAARRGAGANYADRAVIFEECASPFALRISRALADRWEKALRGALQACAAHGEATQRAAAARVADALGGDTRLSLRTYAERLADIWSAEEESRFESSHAPVYRGAHADEDLAALTAGADRQGGDRYAVIDLCPRAADPAALDQASLVLARTHHHLLVRSWLATMHPDPDDFAADAAQWAGTQDELVGLDFGRRNKGWYRFPGPEIALRPPSWTDFGRPDVGWPETYTVEVTGTGVRLHDDTRERRAYVPLSDFVKYPPYSALAHPQVLHPSFEGADEVPEVTVDGVVLQRARWRVAPEQLAAPTPAARFLALRRLATRTGRRFVFCRTDKERKPYLLDLASPLAADLAAHAARDAAVITTEAMLPGPEELWLQDEDGRRYTCELRAQAIHSDAP